MIDTLGISKRLLNSKNKTEYAENIAHILKEREEFHFDKLATKDDITNIRHDMNNLRTLMMWGFAILGVIGAANLTILTLVIKMNVGG